MNNIPFDDKTIDGRFRCVAPKHKPETDNADITARKHGGADTSVQAHNRILPTKSRQRTEVLEFVRARGSHGATTYEVHRNLDMQYTAVSARMSELKRDGEIVDSGKRRKTSTGSLARVMTTPGQKELWA